MIILLLWFLQMPGDGPVTVKDLRSEWLKFDQGTYQPVAAQANKDLHTIYFFVKASSFKGQYLSIKSTEDWNLFLNGMLIQSGKSRELSIDSLARIYADELFFGVNSAYDIGQLRTEVVAPLHSPIASASDNIQRKPTFFRDYAILASAALSIFLVVLFRTNPQLALDYFSFAKIFSVQERNETQLASRITASANLLFYLFCALLTGFFLSAVFYFSGSHFQVAKSIDISSLSSAFVAWLKLSLFILLLLASKLVIVLVFSSLFNFRETISFQFFNFLRFVLFTGVCMGMATLVYFMFRGAQTVFFEKVMAWALVLLSIGSVMVLIKLLARAPFSFLHLFSYLCASEIIPLVIIIKIFF
jgi:hypothetical protein